MFKRGGPLGFFCFFLLFGIPVKASLVQNYALSQKCYYALSADARPADWDRCIAKFKGVEAEAPKSEYAIKSAFSIGRLYQEKYYKYKTVEDLAEAVATYNTFLKNHSTHALADDALFRIGALRLEEYQDSERSEKAFQALLQRYPTGDRVPEAKNYLKKIESGESTLVQTSPPEVVTPVPSPAPVPTQKQTLTSPERFSFQRIVIDPGHGGSDPGAVGPRGTKEKDIALQIAEKLARSLRKQLGVKVYMTRTRDTYLSLEERTAVVDKRQADLFISIHANASESRKASGIETFYLNNASSKAAERLAARENKTSGRNLTQVQKILTAMLQSANTEESRDLAHSVHNGIYGKLNRKYSNVNDLNVHSALFYVLVGTKVPSILIETSFVTNPKEELRLKDSGYQWDLVSGIIDGIRNFAKNQPKSASNL